MVQRRPLVSVVTPVYNGEKYLAECIESVLDQTYPNWEYIILNNCSTDNTLEVAEEYATRDKRIKIISNQDFLKQIPNWNEALRKISPDSKYCKVIHADDWITPECLQKMVTRAEQYPSAGIISAYRFIGSKVSGVRGEGLSYDTKFLTGDETVRKDMKTSLYLFGTPSSILYRSDLIRERKSFYNPGVVHADADICYDILRRSDFAFVHQLLSFTRMHDESTTTFCNYYHTYSLFNIYVIKEYGNHYLTEEEYNRLLSKKISDHHHALVKIMFNGRNKTVWEYHKSELKKMGIRIQPYILLKAFIYRLVKIKPLVKWLLYTIKKLANSNQNGLNKIEKKKENTVAKEAE